MFYTSLSTLTKQNIPAIEHTNVRNHSSHEILLNNRETHVNLYSSLDKTVVLWTPHKKGYYIYIMRPQSSAHSVEWYTFLHTALGWQRKDILQVAVPDLKVTLQITNPFEKIEAERDKGLNSNSQEDLSVISKTIAEEQKIAQVIISRCMEILDTCPEWHDVLQKWANTAEMGLAWKRYDRLEWIHGNNEKKMYGTIAMAKTHELELRPKQHYPTNIEQEDDSLEEPKSMEEPPPVEGFLIRLTSAKGRQQRLGKLFFKRLYFTTHDRYLTYTRPAQALPPPPPQLPMQSGSKIPSSNQITEKIPIVFNVKPYALSDGEITWLKSHNKDIVVARDRDAYDEAERNINSLLRAEGYIDMVQIKEVREVFRGASPADEYLDEGEETDFHQEVSDSHRDDGEIEEMDDDRTFELLLKNDLIIRLQAFNKRTKKLWMERLRNLVAYWKERVAADIKELKQVRAANLEQLHVDEEMEPIIGQYASKWEVTQSIASAQLYNVCGLSSCRTITLSGALYRKPRRHATFKRYQVILCHGQLLVFDMSLRARSGREIPQIHAPKHSSLDLKDCYIYSGLVTESDLLYQNQTFDSNHPGRHALPRVYPDDGWTSSDEDAMTCFVLWHGLKRSLFRAQEEDGSGRHLKLVSQLGTPGRSMVFKTRSRAERDQWVMAISMEIERLRAVEEIRVVST
jgi:Pleckstrin homology domain